MTQKTMTALFDQMKILPFGKDVWHCDATGQTYRITRRGDSFTCTCGADDCLHVRKLLSIEAIAANQVQRGTKHMEDRIAELEARIESMRREMLQVMNLGFVNDRQWIFMDQKYGGLWYRLDSANKVIPIDSKKLIGYIRQLEIKPSGQGAQKKFKLLIHVEADRRYILRCGHTTHFAKGLMMAVANMRIDQIRRPVVIQPQRKDGNLYCNLHQDNRLIRSPYNQETDWRSVAERAFLMVEDANAIGRDTITRLRARQQNQPHRPI